MTSFSDYIKYNFDLEMPHGEISGEWFSENHLPIIVRCSCCDMTMASPSAWIDDDGYTFCSRCAGVSDD